MTDEQPSRPLLRVVRGEPDPAELAALVMVLAAASRTASPEPGEQAPPGRNWGAPRTLVRQAVAPIGWWPGGLPR